MSTFPLVRSKWTNEHTMAVLFGVLALYQIPVWVSTPIVAIDFLLVLITALIIDTTANFIRYKRVICSVSSTITASMLQILTPDIPLWAKLLGVLTGLILGKHIWGGTGKNPINPAITGLLVLSIMFNLPLNLFNSSYLILPALVFSLPFLRYRPFSGLGLISGMIFAMFFNQELSLSSFFSYGVIFWGCLVATDPVTITKKPLYGVLAAILAGFIPIYFYKSTAFMSLSILTLNIISYLLDKYISSNSGWFYSPLRIKNSIIYNQIDNQIIDFTKPSSIQEDSKTIIQRDIPSIPNSFKSDSIITLTKDDILKRIEKHSLYGMGGAAFPVIEKLRTVIDSEAVKKYLIINGVECDPGLIHDKWLLKNHLIEILEGIRFLNVCVDFTESILAVKTDAELQEHTKHQVFKVKNFYPVGAERLLIKEVLGKCIDESTIPAQKGILILNVQTIYSIYKAVYHDKCDLTKYLTFANLKQKTAHVIKVELGMQIKDIIDKISPLSGSAFIGGGLMQSRMAEDEDIVAKTTNFIAIADFPRYKESPQCSKCGLCTLRCPAHLEVNRIADLVDEGKYEAAKRLYKCKCLNCGSCSFVCPAGRNLSTRMKRV